MAKFSQSLLSLVSPDCPVVHRTVSGAPGWLWRTGCSRDFDGGVRLKFTGLFGGAPDCPVSRSQANSSLSGNHQRRTAKIHRSVRWCTGLSGGAPDSVRCARLALANRLLSGLRRRCTAKIHRSVRWCTGLSGEPFTGELVALGKPSTTYG
jgi:hypothetical protein